MEVKTYNLVNIAVPVVFGVVIISLSAYFLHKLSEVNSKTSEMVDIISNQQKILIKHEDAITMIVDNIQVPRNVQFNDNVEVHNFENDDEDSVEEINHVKIPNSTPTSQVVIVGKMSKVDMDKELSNELKELEELDTEESDFVVEEDCKGGVCKIPQKDLDEMIEDKEQEIKVLDEEIKVLDEEIKDNTNEINNIKTTMEE